MPPRIMLAASYFTHGCRLLVGAVHLMATLSQPFCNGENLVFCMSHALGSSAVQCLIVLNDVLTTPVDAQHCQHHKTALRPIHKAVLRPVAVHFGCVEHQLATWFSEPAVACHMIACLVVTTVFGLSYGQRCCRVWFSPAGQCCPTHIHHCCSYSGTARHYFILVVCLCMKRTLAASARHAKRQAWPTLRVCCRLAQLHSA
ncbi:hypothetical protein COO60DRAFT_403193 [Scenedesmus sp. NREL 46B-D3]|nr:hypothetical protein COO60DRAFT_403193 [Scenedesmus sp. NREL 46B-D3]